MEVERKEHGRRLARAEEGAAAAERKLARLEASAAAADVERATSTRVAVAEAGRRRRQSTRLEAKLAEAASRKQSEASRHQESERMLREVRGETSGLERVTEALTQELADSERHMRDTERKALGVARELVDTSQSIASLRGKVASLPTLRQELEEAEREEGMLEHRVETALRDAAASARNAAQSTGQAPAYTAPDADPRGPGACAVHARAGSQGDGDSPGTGGVGSVRSPVARGGASHEHAVNEALRVAWEGEARDRRATEAKLAALQASWLQSRDWLMHLTSSARQWRDELEARFPGRMLQQSIPPPPTEGAWCHDEQLPTAARALCDCLEAFAVEATQSVQDVRSGLELGDGSASFAPRCYVAPDGGVGGVSSLSASPSEIHLQRSA